MHQHRIVVATDLPSTMPQIDAPLPKCNDSSRFGSPGEKYAPRTQLFWLSAMYTLSEGPIAMPYGWFSMEAVDQVEKKLGKPVITTNQVSLWGALRALGHTESINGYGTLLQNHLR